MKKTLKKVCVRSPTRIDLSGGTLDLWPLYLFFKKSFVINFSLDIYTQVEIEEKKDSSIELDLTNFKYKKKFLNLKSFLSFKEEVKGKFRGKTKGRAKKKRDLQKNKSLISFLNPHLNYWEPKSGFSLKAFSQSPLQSGMGGSSSLCISLIKAFSIWLKGRNMKKEEMIHLASNMEASGLGFPTGTQDYFSPVQSGLHIIEYGLKKKLFFKKVENEWKEVFKQNSLLIDTGKMHHSASLNWEIYKAFLNRDKKVVKALEKLSYISEQVVRVCQEGKWEELPYFMNQEFLVRLKLSKDFAPLKVLNLRKEIFKRGGEAFKLCGAGGGGVAFVWASSLKARKKISLFCEKNGFHRLKARPLGKSILFSSYS